MATVEVFRFEKGKAPVLIETRPATEAEQATWDAMLRDLLAMWGARRSRSWFESGSESPR